MRIVLNATELMVAAYIGSARNVQSTLGGAKPSAGMSMSNSWTANIEGAQGEMAVAKYLGRYWVPKVGDRYNGDVGPYEVRTNGSRKHDDTCLRPDDFDDRVYIGVLSFMPEFEIIGWIWGRDGMAERWLRDGERGRPKCFYVPRSALQPLELLPFGEPA